MRKEQRDPDQAEAESRAFVAGTLPEDDRRAEPIAETDVGLIASVLIDPAASLYRDNSKGAPEPTGAAPSSPPAQDTSGS